MPTICTPTPTDKGASYNEDPPALSTLQTQLSKHETFHRRVKAVNAALRKARIDPADPDASERSREVLRGVLQDERLVDMYLRQLWQVGRSGAYLKFPSAVLVRNGQTIRTLRESLETQTGRSGASNTRRPSAINSNLEGTS